MISSKEFRILLEYLNNSSARYFKIEKDDERIEIIRSLPVKDFGNDVFDGNSSGSSDSFLDNDKNDRDLDRDLTSDVLSPYVGVFQRAKEINDKVIVKLREVVLKGKVLAYVRSLGLYYEVVCDVDEAKIIEILVENGQVVEYGQPLFRLRSISE